MSCLDCAEKLNMAFYETSAKDKTMVDDAFFALTRDIKKRLGESSSSQSAKPKDSVTVRFSLCAVVYIQNCSAHLRDVLVVYPDPVILLKRNTSRPTLLPPPPTSTLALPPRLRPVRSPEEPTRRAPAKNFR